MVLCFQVPLPDVPIRIDLDHRLHAVPFPLSLGLAVLEGLRALWDAAKGSLTGTGGQFSLVGFTCELCSHFSRVTLTLVTWV